MNQVDDLMIMIKKTTIRVGIYSFRIQIQAPSISLEPRNYVFHEHDFMFFLCVINVYILQIKLVNSGFGIHATLDLDKTVLWLTQQKADEPGITSSI